MDEANDGGAPAVDFQEALRRGAIEKAAERLLSAAMGENVFDRETVFDAARSLPDVSPLIGPLERGLRAGDSAERRNAARSVLAELARPGAADADRATRILVRLAETDPDLDVRILSVNALGESGNPAARDALERVVRDPDLNIAAAAADALGVLGDAAALEVLGEAVFRADPWVRVAAVVALGKLGHAGALPILERALSDPFLVEAALTAIGTIGDPAGLGLLEEHAAAESPHRDTALDAAAAILITDPDVTAPESVRNSLAERVDDLRERLLFEGDESAALLLGAIGDEAAAAALVDALAGSEPAAAAAGFARLPDDLVRRVLLSRLATLEPEHRVWAIASLPPLSTKAMAERLIPYLGSEDADLRAAAAELFGRSPDALVAPLLVQALGDPHLRYGAARALGMLGSTRCGPLAELLEDPDPLVRRAAAEGLARCATPDVRARILRALGMETELRTRVALVEALGMAAGAEAIAGLDPLLEDDAVELRFAAVRALGHTGSHEALPLLVRALGDPMPEIRGAALQALGDLGDQDAARAVAPFLSSTDADLRFAAATALRRIPADVVVDRLIAALEDPAWAVRNAAARALGSVREVGAVPALTRAAQADPDPLVREASKAALQSISSGESGGET